MATDQGVGSSNLLAHVGKNTEWSVFFFCYGDEENEHRACTDGHLKTADQSEIRKAYLTLLAKESETSFLLLNPFELFL